ncbi:hypothetical protein KXW24_000798 [Aspergillus fumigatus]|nr:hypothetical protein KXX39_008303 [Aspergillus fumigatus]KAH3500076.1 hypothetical protein KXW24_000798 [Aspergillus fumigatus]
MVRLDGKPLDTGLPKHMVKAAGWDEWVDEDEEDLLILDLGERGSFKDTSPKPFNHTNCRHQRRFSETPLTTESTNGVQAA